MMRTHQVDTIGRDGATGSTAPLGHWTVRGAVGASSPLARFLGASTVVAALASALSTRVPLAAAVTVALLVASALVDVIDRRLPNRMVGAALMGGTVVAFGTVLVGGEIDLRSAAIGALAFAGPVLAMHLVAPSSMGFGDVKIGCVLGAAVGLIHPAYGLVALTTGSLIGAVVGLVARRRTIAFGPALVAGALAVLLLAASPASPDLAESPDRLDRPNAGVRS